METLFEQSQQRIKRVKSDFFRSIFYTIDWNCRLIEIKGPRGVGKTTLMLQQAQKLSKTSSSAVLYVSLDDPYFYNHTIIDTADYFIKFGGLYLFLDEVHKYPSKFPKHDWSTEIKVIYDRYPDLQVIYSGSSVLQLFKGHGDLSRRKCSYNLPGLSFREYINWINRTELPVCTLSQVINNHTDIAKTITNNLKIIPLFIDYLKHGYYPYYKEAPDQFCNRLRDTINVILEQDLPAVASFSHENHIKLKKLLAVLAESVPYTPNLTNLRSELFIADQRTLLNYLDALEKAELLTTLDKAVKGMKKMQKPSKIYLNNTNLLNCLFFDKPNTGTQRETFFFNQLRNNHSVNYPEKGDFIVDSRYTFEIGGKNKPTLQIQEVPDSFLAIDDVEIGFGNKIPLWLFGFLY
ncbi:MAG TPA: AAA family ATPase [Bacteroidales bacterium]|nr:AAA family ATPase [Bacteroidales bacterium]